MAQGGLRQRLTAILAADVAGYTRLMAADAGATVAALDEARALFRREIEAHAGRVVDMAGDSVLALFDSASGAVNAALAVQSALEGSSIVTPEERRLRVRIGVHLGDVIEKADGTIYGHGVNVAARLQEKAAPGGVCMSEALYDAVKDKLGERARFAGRQRFKNIAEAIAVWQIVPEGAPAPAPYELEATPHNLPLQLTSFIGREAELGEAARLLGEARLLTLLGVGGIGKSRLSLELAAQVMSDFPDGVWLVELATLRDARLVPQAVASVLGVKELAGRPVSEALIEHFRERRTLLILDNCEHLLQGCAEFSRQVLQSAAHCKILASSREALRVAGERTYALPVLPEGEAERLFVDRARAAAPSFRMNGNAAAVATVCRRLDGIPLAIELAAARVRTMPVDAIAERLNDRFRLLTGGDRTALPRQQTLRALIDWSYELLSEAERAVFRRLAVFAGGWTLEAAEAVTAFGAVEQASVLEQVTQLTEKSLAVLDAERSRYRLLETVREYAHERLAQSGELDEARKRHLDYFLAFAEQARPQLAGPRQAEWLARLDAERENFLAAHACCSSERQGAEAGLRLAYLLRPYWLNRGLLGLGYRFTIEALGHSGAAERGLARCSGLFDAGQLSCFMGRYREGQEYLEQSLAIAREFGDQRRVAVVLQPLSMAYLGQGDARTAQRYAEEAVACAQALGEPREIGAALNSLAAIERAAGHLDRAESLYERLLELARELDDRESIAIGLLNLAMVTTLREDRMRAREMLLAVLAIVQETGSKPAGQSVLEVCAGLAARSSDWPRAARLYGAAEAQALRSGLRRDPADEAFLQPLVGQARAQLGDARFAAAEQAGRALSDESALGEAGEWLKRIPSYS